MTKSSRIWGNALGGWKRQTRDVNGRFSHGKSGPAKSPKKSPNKSPTKSPKKSPKNGSQARKKWSNKKKAVVAAGATAGVVVAGVAAYSYDYRRVKKDFNRTGSLSTFTDKGGVSFTQERTFRKGRKLSFNEEAFGAFLEAPTKRDKVREFVAMADFSVRPQVDTTTWIHRDDELLGYAKTVSQGNRLRANTVFLRASERRSGRTVAAASRYVKQEQKSAVENGRKIVVHRYRSADSERVVRNQRKHLGEKNVKVQRRFAPKSDMTYQIIKSLDTDFFYNKKDQFKKVQARKKSGVVI